ncbi:hypothetical protein [Streptomyces sp. NPDC056844]|uniref:hypothetical protein n=1 Tax=unclassified Streptomyces TaxID=2593676 RepID=UPI003687BE15
MTTAAVRPAGLGNVWTLPGVYAPQADTYLLAEALQAEEIAKGTDLDVCTGSGALAVLAARMGARVSATDISRRAVMTCPGGRWAPPAVPGPVHTLDGRQHRVRKALFTSLLTDRSGPGSLAGHLRAEWDLARQRWAGRDQVVLCDESSLLLTRAVCAWSGVPLDDVGTEEMARDLVAMVDGFASPGPRHLRARRARSRQEERLARLVEAVRNGTKRAPADSALGCRGHPP